MKLQILIPMFSFVAITGCSKSSDGGASAGPVLTVSPLSVEQKARFDRTAAHIASGTQWQGFGATTPAPVTIEDRGALEKEVTQKCVFNPTHNSTMSPQGADPMINTQEDGSQSAGDECPIQASFLSSSRQSTSKGTISFSYTHDFAIHYFARLESARKALDIQKYDLTIANSSQNSTSGYSDTSTGSGTIVSQSEGTVKIGYAFSSTFDQGVSVNTTTTTLVYPDGLVAELKCVSTTNSVTGQTTIVFSLNGKEIDDAMYHTYVMQFGINHN